MPGAWVYRRSTKRYSYYVMFLLYRFVFSSFYDSPVIYTVPRDEVKQ